MTAGPSKIRGFLHRLSMYAFGIAIGLLFLATIQRLKQAGQPASPTAGQQAPEQAPAPASEPTAEPAVDSGSP